MNVLSKSEVLAENKLFATVDATVRKVSLESVPFLLSDTVGFIRKLPHHLIESFKSTLDEVREADILVHVVDVAHPFHDNQIDVVTRTLSEIGAANIPAILVLNKVDILKIEHPDANLEEMKGYYREHGFQNIVFISATTKENMDVFKKVLYEEVKKKHLALYPNYLQEGNPSLEWENLPIES
jgi:GTP-binding protein HflX